MVKKKKKTIKYKTFLKKIKDLDHRLLFVIQLFETPNEIKQ